MRPQVNQELKVRPVLMVALIRPILLAPPALPQPPALLQLELPQPPALLPQLELPQLPVPLLQPQLLQLHLLSMVTTGTHVVTVGTLALGTLVPILGHGDGAHATQLATTWFTGSANHTYQWLWSI